MRPSNALTALFLGVVISPLVGCDHGGSAAFVVAAAPMAQRALHEPSCRAALASVPDPAAPHGLFVWLSSLHETQAMPEILQYLPFDKRLCGASIVVQWSEVDKGPGSGTQYDFSRVERAIRAWARHGKLVDLLVSNVNEVGTADTATPAWVLAQSGRNKVDVVPCASPGPGMHAGPPTPVYWERGFEAPYRAFIEAFVSKYGGDARIRYMRFGVGPGSEDFVQHGADGTCFQQWSSFGLSAKSWALFSASQVRFVASLGSKAQQLVAINAFDDVQQPFNVPSRVAEAAAHTQTGFGTENLGSGNYGKHTETCTKNSPVPYWCHPFLRFAGQVPLQFQTISYTYNPKFPKLATLPELLPYAIANDAQIFELYPQDWLVTDDPYYPGYGRHQQAWSKALTAAAGTLGYGN